MDIATFHDILAQENARGYDLNGEQKGAVEHGDSPLWLLAGPGSGKSEVLVTRTLKLLCVDQVHPKSVLLTTFTKKAARNLEDRLAYYLAALQDADPSLKEVDVADLRIGTIHGLCNDILQEHRYSEYQNVRLLDDVEQHLFAYRNAEISKYKDLDFWRQFDYAVPGWSAGSSYEPNRWKRTKAAIILFNHVVEDLVDLGRMRSERGHWAALAGFYEQYRDALGAHHRCDFAHLQSFFLRFLGTPQGSRFLNGDGEDHPPLRYVLVDEYQDTNPIQERIYLAVAGRPPHNLTVVGDDDQALYRFRGGTVACMVNFHQACRSAYGLEPRQIQLADNYRSHERIVRFFNDYIAGFPEMNEPGVRAPGKQPVDPSSSIEGDYPAVAWITRGRVSDLPDAVAILIKDHLLADGIISDCSQCVLLLRSARDSARNAGPFLEAFARHGIPVYNPRSKSFLENEEVQCLLATLVHLVDPHFTFQDVRDPDGSIPSWVTTASGWLDRLHTAFAEPEVPTAQLEGYLETSKVALAARCAAQPNQYLNLTLAEIVYRVLSLEPFQSWRQDPERNLRISKVTRLIDGYHSMNLDVLRANEGGTGLHPGLLQAFYHVLLRYLIDAGLDEDEDEDVIVPEGRLPIMTIHQSKGLEFPFVLVGQLGNTGWVGAAQRLEHELAPFRDDLYPRTVRDPALLALEDDIRLLYVAYSRAQYGLILVGTRDHLKKHVALPGRDLNAFCEVATAI